MKYHMAFAETQAHETHTDFEHAEKHFTTQSCVVVVGGSDMRVKGLVEGTAIDGKSTLVRQILSFLRKFI